MDSPNFDRSKALEQQIALLVLRKEHLDHLIALARGIKIMGGGTMDFTAFDTSKLEEYASQARDAWGDTAEYREFEEKAKGRTKKEEQNLNVQMMAIFAEFGTMLGLTPDSEIAQAQVKKLQDFISGNYYQCSDEVLHCLGKMYAGGGDFTQNIDKAGGPGTAEYVCRAIEVYCGK